MTNKYKTPIKVMDFYPLISHRKIKTRPLKNIQYLMIHHSASYQLSLPKLYKLHTTDLHKWPTIGYHFFVPKSNIIYQVNELNNIVNGCKNFNSKTIHVCFDGNYQHEILPHYFDEVISSILYYLKDFKIFPEITYHQKHSNTHCPGTNIINHIESNYMKNKNINGLIWPEFK